MILSYHFITYALLENRLGLMTEDETSVSEGDLSSLCTDTDMKARCMLPPVTPVTSCRGRQSLPCYEASTESLQTPRSASIVGSVSSDGAHSTLQPWLTMSVMEQHDALNPATGNAAAAVGVIGRHVTSSDGSADTGGSDCSDAEKTALRQPSCLSYTGSVSCQSTKSSIADALLRSSGRRFGRDASAKPKRAYNLTKNQKRKAVEGATLHNRDKKRKKLADAFEKAAVLAKDCCGQECLKRITFQDLDFLRAKVSGNSQSDNNNWFMSSIKSGLSQLQSNGGKYMFPVETGQMVCSQAFCLLFGVSLRHFRTLTKMVKDGLMDKLRMPRTSSGGNAWVNFMPQFLRDYAREYGSQMPNSDKIELTVGAKIQIFWKFTVFCEGIPGLREHKHPLTESWFYRMWKERCPDIICPRRNQFSKCDECCEFKHTIESCKEYALRLKAVQRFDEHLRHQMQERNQYYANRAHAIRCPHEAMSVIIDGMRQSTTELPYFPRDKPKAASVGQNYCLHVVGALVHGSTPLAFVHDSRVPTGPNLIMEVLYRTLVKSKLGKFPPLLYLQLDNCSGENKNHWVFEFCAMLVEARVFQEVCFGVQIILNSFLLPLGPSRLHDGWSHT